MLTKKSLLPLGDNLSGTNYNSEAGPKGVGQEPNIEGWDEGCFEFRVPLLILGCAD